MKSEMAIKLKEILDNTSQEEFDREWSEIMSLGLQGPSVSSIIAHFSVAGTSTITYEYNENIPYTRVVEEESPCLAA